MKKEIKQAVDKFLKHWGNEKEIVGVIVCGSHITGNPTIHSDIDLQIFLRGDVKWRERGNKIVEGYLIEYFANPFNQNLKYFEKDFKRNRKINVHMFTTGEILFDKNGDVKKIIAEAKRWDRKKFSKPKKDIVELNKYALWDMLDNLEEVFESGNEDFYFVYHNFLHNLFEIYSKFVGFHSVGANKLRRFIADEKDKKKYRIPDFPDKKFVGLFIESLGLAQKEVAIKHYTKLTKYVLKKMGGFEVDGWKLRSEVEI